MKHRVSLLCMALGVTGLVTLGAPIDGKWTVEVQGQKGAQTQTLTLKSDGTKLSGSLDTGRGAATEITEGKVDGMNVSFKATRTGRNGNVTTTAYTGKLTGEDLKLTATREGGGSGKGGGAQELDFKHAK
jgi:hypothetical protein